MCSRLLFAISSGSKSTMSGNGFNNEAGSAVGGFLVEVAKTKEVEAMDDLVPPGGDKGASSQPKAALAPGKEVPAIQVIPPAPILPPPGTLPQFATPANPAARSALAAGRKKSVSG